MRTIKIIFTEVRDRSGKYFYNPSFIQLQISRIDGTERTESLILLKISLQFQNAMHNFGVSTDKQNDD